MSVDRPHPLIPKTKTQKYKMENGLIKTSLPITEIMSIGKAFQESGMFPDIKTVAQAVVKIQAGQEIGIQPFAAMTGIHIIQGKPTIGAGLIASRIKGSGKYDFMVKEMSDKNCIIEFYQGQKHIGTSSFSISDAQRAGTKNLDRFPRNMLFARAISNGVKWYCPDVFSGPVYTPEDFNVESKLEDPAATVVQMPENFFEQQSEHVREFTKDDFLELPNDVEIPTMQEKDMLKALVWTADLDETKRQTALFAIDACTDYKEYEKLQHRLESLQPSIEEVPNPNQGDIKKHVRKLSKLPA